LHGNDEANRLLYIDDMPRATLEEVHRDQSHWTLPHSPNVLPVDNSPPSLTPASLPSTAQSVLLPRNAIPDAVTAPTNQSESYSRAWLAGAQKTSEQNRSCSGNTDRFLFLAYEAPAQRLPQTITLEPGPNPRKEKVFILGTFPISHHSTSSGTAEFIAC
jgi:hypothetical protein